MLKLRLELELCSVLHAQRVLMHLQATRQQQYHQLVSLLLLDLCWRALWKDAELQSHLLHHLQQQAGMPPLRFHRL